MTSELGRWTLLVVDDEPSNVTLLQRMLQRAGYERIVGATDPSTAVELYETHHPDIVLLDLSMPQIDGFELMSRLRELPGAASVPMVMLTADGTWEAKQRALMSGASDFLTKPFEQAEVLARIANLLETRRLHLELERHSERLEEEVRTRTAELSETEARLFQAQKMEAIGQLAGGIAHDFNNLLAVIINYAILILDALPSEDPIRDDVAEIQRAGQSAAALTRQLLAFSRKETVRRLVLDLNQTVGEMERLLARAVGEDIVLEVDLAEDLRPTKLDPSQLEQILINLAVNARDAMRGGGHLRVETFDASIDADFVSTHPGAVQGNYVCLRVTDTGSGMDESVRTRLFDPFFTTKERGIGTGLGLATVYGIVKQAEGYIDVESEVGTGTTFTLYFPATEEALSKAPDEASKRRPATGRPTILLVEDEDGVRRVVERLLVRNGFEVFTASDGTDALAIVKDQGRSIDLLLTDFVIPGISATELSSTVRDLRPAVSVVYMSGYTDSKVGEMPLEDDILLRKPFTENELIHVVHEALGAE